MNVSVEAKFAQKLAANEKADRDKAVKKLKKWLHSRSASSSPLQEDELLRIWKGLFYCYWMSDKPLIQEELANNIASMIGVFSSNDSALLFIKTFLLTMSREWFGIDNWRMDKFMMMTRRFLRQVFKFNSKHKWNQDVTTCIRDVLADNLLLREISETSLGFQMHVTDLFLEELAKVGGEDLEEDVILCYLQPFLQIVQKRKEPRLRSHVVERVFHYLLRQSDPGIEWEMEKEVESLGNIVVAENEEFNEDGVDEEDIEADIADKVEDPRAGRVDVELPQLKIDYQALSERLFELGSDEDTTVDNRNTLYQLSKYFKDAANNVFPLGDNISDEEDDEKINVKAAVKELTVTEEKRRKENLDAKEEYDRIMKEKKRLSKTATNNGIEDFLHDDAALTEKQDLKRKLDEEEQQLDNKVEEEEPAEAKKARLEGKKLTKKEWQRLRKQKTKREKRERMLKEAIQAQEARRKADLLVEKDLEIRTTMEEQTQQKSAQSKKTNKNTINCSSKKDDNNSLHDNNSDKKKKEATVEFSNNQQLNTKQKKKKEPAKQSSENQSVSNENKKKKTKDALKLSKNNQVKEGKKKKELVKLSEDNLTADKENKIIQKTSDNNLPADKPKKKKKDSNKTVNGFDETLESAIVNGSSSSHPAKKLTSQNVDSPVVKKKKMHNNATTESTKSTKSKENNASLLFDEPTDWESDLKPGEQEIVLPNKKYKGNTKLTPPKLAPEPSQGLPHFEKPKISTPNLEKSHTALFLKKALSKSATPKKKKFKLDELRKINASSEPRMKRVNFALTKNASQDISDLLSSIASSPGIPHDPSKNPEKSLLKRRSNSDSANQQSPGLHPVQLNTQLNAISRQGKKLMGKKRRMMAKDFFEC